MAWFDRNLGGKKDSAEDRPAPEPGPSGAAPLSPSAPSVPSAPVVDQVAPKPSEEELVAYLYKGSRVTGQLTFQGPAKIEGNVEGEIRCQARLTVGEGAEVRAKIAGQIVVIHGKVEGNVAAKERVELVAPARLNGNIDAPRLIITEGVVFDGDCSMGKAREKGGVASAQSVSAEKASGAKPPKLNADSKT